MSEKNFEEKLIENDAEQLLPSSPSEVVARTEKSSSNSFDLDISKDWQEIISDIKGVLTTENNRFKKLSEMVLNFDHASKNDNSAIQKEILLLHEKIVLYEDLTKKLTNTEDRSGKVIFLNAWFDGIKKHSQLLLEILDARSLNNKKTEELEEVEKMVEELEEIKRIIQEIERVSSEPLPMPLELYNDMPPEIKEIADSWKKNIPTDFNVSVDGKWEKELSVLLRGKTLVEGKIVRNDDKKTYQSPIKEDGEDERIVKLLKDFDFLQTNEYFSKDKSLAQWLEEFLPKDFLSKEKLLLAKKEELHKKLSSKVGVDSLIFFKDFDNNIKQHKLLLSKISDLIK